MGISKICKCVFTLNCFLLILAFVYKFSIIHIINYFINALLFIILFNDSKITISRSELKIIICTVLVSLMDILFSFVFDSHNPNFMVAFSLLTYLIFNRLFTNIDQKQYLFTGLTLFSFILLFPSVASDVGKEETFDSILIIRNVPLYLYMIFYNISILNLSKIISNNNSYLNKSKKIIFLFFIFFLIGGSSLFLMSKFYFASLSGILMNLLSLLAVTSICINFIWKNNFFKVLFISLSTILGIYFLNSIYFEYLTDAIRGLWWVNNVAQGSIFDGSHRTDFIGFLRCFLDYPLGTGFYGMEKLCTDQSYYSLPGGIQPHNAIISFFLGYPLIAFLIIYYLVFSKNIRENIMKKLLISFPLPKENYELNFFRFARYFHLASFLLSIMTSEMHLRFPLF